MNTEAWWNLCKTIIAGILIAVAAFIGLEYLLPPLFPFIIALVCASLIRPCAAWCRRRIGIGAKPVSVIMILGFFTLLCLLLWTTGSRLATECAKFLVALTKSSNGMGSPLRKLVLLLEELKDKLPIGSSDDGGIDIYKMAEEFISGSAAKLSSAAADIAAAFIKKLPSALIATGVCFIALFYLALDYEGATAAVREFLPSDTGERFVSGYRRVSRALWKYLRAYFTIMLVTFAELYLGFVLLRIEYALLFASVTAIVDFLPILGVGTVLIPWSGAAFLTGNYRIGTGLLIIYAFATIVRQFLEPKIVGDFIGTHPVIALLGVYVGLRLFGIGGMIAAPIILYLIRVLRTEDKKSP